MPPTRLAPEERRLIAAAVWTEPPADLPERVSAVRGEAAWERLRRAASAEGLAPLLFHRLREKGLLASAAPRAARRLRADYLESTAANLIRLRALARVLAALDADAIPCAVLKGAALALLVYEEPGLRPMGDVDLLVRPEDVARADGALHRLGLDPVDSPPPLPASVPEGPLASLDYRGTGPETVSFHLHWNLLNSTIPPLADPGVLPAAALLGRARDASSLFGAPARTLSPPDFLLHLCEHLLRVPHSASRLVWLGDVDRLLRRTEIPWQTFVTLARGCLLHRAAFLSLRLAEAHAGARLPGNPADLLAGEGLRPLERAFLSLALRDFRPPGLAILVHIAHREGIASKARFLRAALLPSRRALGRRRGKEAPAVGLWDRLARLGEAGRAIRQTFGWTIGRRAGPERGRRTPGDLRA